MNTYFKVILVVAFCLVLGAGTNQAQNLGGIMYELYEHSVMYPESFDALIQKNQGIFNQSFHSHLNCVTKKLYAMARVEIEICKGHVNPEWRRKCMNENTAVGLFLWIESTRQVIDGEKTWSETWSGSTILYAKRITEQMGMDYVALVRMGLQMIGQQLRALLMCN